MRFLFSLLAWCCIFAAYAEDAPESIRHLQNHKLQAAPDADQSLTSVTELPLVFMQGNHWQLPQGLYAGHFVLDVPIHLSCAEGAVFDAQGQKNALNIRAPNSVLEGCRFQNWGADLTNMNSAIFVERSAEQAVIKNNHSQGQGFGIWVDATRGIQILNNKIQGDERVRTQDRGNGIHLYAVLNGVIAGNELWQVRDGLYIEASNDNLIDNNYLHDMRYGVHYMFSHRNKLINNLTERTRTGYTLMQSRQLHVENNRSNLDQNYGILMNYITYSTIKNNFVTDVQAGQGDGVHIQGGEGKGIFIYNSLFNSITGNSFKNSALGIHLTAGSEDNKIHDNAFIHNQTQVKYVAVRYQEWSVDGRGNYWSDYLGWDRNSDGLGDIPYEPNDNVDKLLWNYPQVRLLMNSPAIEVLRLVQRAFPVVKYPGVQDSHPLMTLPSSLPK